MKDRAYRALEHLKKVKTADWAIKAIGDYIDFCEREASDAQMDVLAEKKLDKGRGKILKMLGFYMHPDITGRTIGFLYDNIEEIRGKNKDKSLEEILYELQVLLDKLDAYSQVYDCEQIVVTPGDIKELQKEINKRYKQRLEE